MIEKIIIAGSGGQGVLTLGMYLAQIASFEGKNAAWLPAYGAEKRGGPSFCSLIISDREIFSPVVETPDTLIVFDQRALDNYAGKAGPGTLVIENSSLILEDRVKGANKLLIPAGEIAGKLDEIRVANIVLAGAYAAAKKIFNTENAAGVMKEMLGKKAVKMMEKNLAAFREGFAFASKPAERI
jgi:2-oxoglutarate ferredoxin oxidoreductase subunit gamma